MNGIEFLRKLMPQYPLRVVVISSLSDKVFDAMQAGAVDFVAKPSVSNRVQLEEFVKNELLVKIKIASTAKIGSIKKKVMEQTENRLSVQSNDLLVAIGASTGGTEAILEVVKGYGPDIPGIVVVQHMPPGFTAMYAKRVNDICRVQVKEAETGDRVMPGHMLIAPGGDRHMQLVKVNGVYQVECKRGRRSMDIVLLWMCCLIRWQEWRAPKRWGSSLPEWEATAQRGFWLCERPGREPSDRMSLPAWFTECRRLPMT